MNITDEVKRGLYLQAKEISQRAYAPYSKFQVGAALLTEDGQVFTGVNVENSSFGATICAERNVATTAITQEQREFAALAVASSDGEAWPCGICRQFLYEFAPELPVISGPDEDHLQTHPLSELLRKGFRL